MINEYIKGDIVKLFLDGSNVAHGCNCFHTMGGIAGQLAKAYPPIYEIDKTTDYGSSNKLGSYTEATGEYDQICFNLYTQYYPGPDLCYGSLLSAFESLNNWAKVCCVCTPTVYIPRIGSGIAGGDWNKIEAIINMFTPDVNIIVVDWDGA